jgi:hypothetical protein
MNKENIQRLIDTLRARSNQFNMGCVVQTREPLIYQPDSEPLADPNDCGTSCCILGWTNAIINGMKPLEEYQFQEIEEAAQFLDLDHTFFYALCFPFGTFHPWQTAYNMGLLTPNPKLINRMLDQPKAAFYPFNATPNQAITVLEAIRDGVIPSTPYTPPPNDPNN